MNNHIFCFVCISVHLYLLHFRSLLRAVPYRGSLFRLSLHLLVRLGHEVVTDSPYASCISREKSTYELHFDIVP